MIHVIKGHTLSFIKSIYLMLFYLSLIIPINVGISHWFSLYNASEVNSWTCLNKQIAISENCCMRHWNNGILKEISYIKQYHDNIIDIFIHCEFSRLYCVNLPITETAIKWEVVGVVAIWHSYIPSSDFSTGLILNFHSDDLFWWKTFIRWLEE